MKLRIEIDPDLPEEVIIRAPAITDEIRKLQDTIEQRKQYLAGLEEQARETRRTIEQLKNNDPAAIEAIARDKFGYTREGEEIYQVDKPAPAAGGEKAATEALPE